MSANEFHQCKFMNHPSREYIIPVESIPGNGVKSWCSNNTYLCHYHHYVEHNNEYCTRIEVISLNENLRIADLIYTWNGCPVWAFDPRSTCLALTICDEFFAFVTTELYGTLVKTLNH